ncbi:MAG: non-canonical purine NTP pyrophosphatase [Defluviitaleaceae bacterium]|nr:non-canonical purine NTP pyrophosphatase [Defluviitaleaceae bacterium]
MIDKHQGKALKTKLQAAPVYLLATNNPNKAKEIKPMFDAAGLTLITLADLGLHFEAGEDGNSFTANATQKAMETAAFIRSGAAAISPLPIVSKPGGQLSCSDIAVLADDSGLVIDMLGGEPGVDSALYLGRDTPYTQKCQDLITRLDGVSNNKRTARFVCMLVCIMPDGTQLLAEGTIEGRIAHAMYGEGGFGYDPIFYYPPYGKTMAELTQDEKNLISHRGQAITKMIGLIVDDDTGNK